MKNFTIKLTSLFFLVFVFTNWSTIIYAQDNASRLYVQFDYMKSKTTDYVEVEGEIWRPIQEHRVKNHELLYWGVYQVDFPSGSKRDYDYITMNVYDDIDLLGQGISDLDQWIKDVHPNETVEGISQKTLESRDLVWSEVFEILAQALPPKKSPGPYVMANLMKVTPGKESAYEKMEKEIYMPAHSIAANKGLRINWHLLKRIVPRGTEYGYNYMTLDVYDRLGQMVVPVPEEVWHSAHPGRDLNRFFQEIDVQNMRELIHGEVWKLIHYVTPE